jgi:hypothetical protein
MNEHFSSFPHEQRSASILVGNSYIVQYLADYGR